jgi:dynein assembly factor 1, axonemal
LTVVAAAAAILRTNVECCSTDIPRCLQIDGLSHLTELRCLFLQQNLITSIRNLDTLVNLKTLDLSNNKITKVEGLSALPALSLLNLSKNALETADSLFELVDCTALKSLDLSDNLLVDSPGVLDVMTRIPEVTCLYLKGNPLVRATKFYRKTVLSTLPRLSYLDDSPVFEPERRAVAAWVSGGREAELAEKKVRSLVDGTAVSGRACVRPCAWCVA